MHNRSGGVSRITPEYHANQYQSNWRVEQLAITVSSDRQPEADLDLASRATDHPVVAIRSSRIDGILDKCIMVYFVSLHRFTRPFVFQYNFLQPFEIRRPKTCDRVPSNRRLSKKSTFDSGVTKAYNEGR
jgi:hypothetical protein